MYNFFNMTFLIYENHNGLTSEINGRDAVALTDTRIYKVQNKNDSLLK